VSAGADLDNPIRDVGCGEDERGLAARLARQVGQLVLLRAWSEQIPSRAVLRTMIPHSRVVNKAEVLKCMHAKQGVLTAMSPAAPVKDVLSVRRDQTSSMHAASPKGYS
jgi:hypothetical protein